MDKSPVKVSNGRTFCLEGFIVQFYHEVFRPYWFPVIYMAYDDYKILDLPVPSERMGSLKPWNHPNEQRPLWIISLKSYAGVSFLSYPLSGLESIKPVPAHLGLWTKGTWQETISFQF